MTGDPLSLDVQFLKGVGPARGDLLKRLGIETVRDLLLHLPRSFDDLTNVRSIAALETGKLQTVHGEVVEMEGRRLADGRSVVSIVISDGKNILEGAWFNQVYASSRFRYGQRVSYSGKPKKYQGHWQMVNPSVQIMGDATPGNDLKIVPIYPLTQDLRGDQLRAILAPAVEQFAALLPEFLPRDLLEKRHFPALDQALRDIHRPESLEQGQVARRRFIYEEFLVLQVALALRRRDLRDRLRAPLLQTTPSIDARIRRLLPFALTQDQNRAVGDICRDMASTRPMQRLLQADVGAGKTVVALYALLVAVANKHQAIFMAPTEILAQQHWQTLAGYLEKSRLRLLLLTGARAGLERRHALDAVRRGDVDLVIGTQALLQTDVGFNRLGLVVIDEQHKFGVNQRARLRHLGGDPHYLVMTATPIPRTLALTIFGDLDISTIHELPPGRRPVMSRWAPTSHRERIYSQMKEKLSQGRQGYVVCPFVEESENQDVRAAVQTFAQLQAGVFRDLRLGLVHGRLGDQDKDNVMAKFRGHELDVLVATNVVEVGVDVPNATVMVVEQADRFGLAQLHQLRGRVSRGTVSGECVLIADPSGEDAQDRLRAFTRVQDGFRLAEEDARLRGMGEFFGTRQHGIGEFRVANLLTDGDLLRLARRDAIALVARDAGLRLPEHLPLRQRVLERYGATLDLPAIG